jgi:hypothetical protein
MSNQNKDNQYHISNFDTMQSYNHIVMVDTYDYKYNHACHILA